MSTYFCPTERCTIDQAKENSKLLGLKILKQKNGRYCVYDINRSGFLEVEGVWIRGAYCHGDSDLDESTRSIISEVTNCEWIDEYDHEAMQVYLFWYDDEILREAEACTDDGIEGHPFDEWGTREQELENEIDYLYSRRKKFGVVDGLPIAEPVYKFKVFKACA